MRSRAKEVSHANIGSAIDSTAKGANLARRRMQNPKPYKSRNGELWKSTVALYEYTEQGEFRRRKEISLGPTKTMNFRQAQHALRPYVERANATAFNPTRKHKTMTFTEFAGIWEAHYLSLSKPSTQATMKTHLRRLKSAFGPRDMRTISAADLQRFVSELVAEEYAPKTIRNIWITLRLIWSAAHAQGYVEAIPAKPKLPRMLRTRPRCFTLTEVAKILAASDEDDNAFALYWTAAETGMRLGELDGLKSYAFDHGTSSYIEVSETVWNGKRGTPKSPAAIRRIYISEQLSDLLNSLTSPETLFRSSVVNYRKRKLQPLLERLGISRAGFHAFRHFNASLMDSLRIPLKTRHERLGHASTGSLTLDVYTHSSEEGHYEAARLIGNAIEIAVHSVSLSAVQQKGLPTGASEALETKQQIGCGGQI